MTSFFLDVDGCGDSEYALPGDGGPGSVHTNTRTWTTVGRHRRQLQRPPPPRPASTSASQGNTTGEGCTMKAHYEHSHPHGAPGHVDTCSAHNRVHAGDRYSVVAR